MKARFLIILLVIAVVVGIVCPSDGAFSYANNQTEITAETEIIPTESDSDDAAYVVALIITAVVVVCIVSSCNSPTINSF